MTTIQDKKKYIEVDTKPYQPFGLGIPILLFLSGVAAIALMAICIYEWII